MDLAQIMEIIKTFLDAIAQLFQSLGLDKLFKKEDAPADETTTEA